MNIQKNIWFLDFPNGHSNFWQSCKWFVESFSTALSWYFFEAFPLMFSGFVGNGCLNFWAKSKPCVFNRSLPLAGQNPRIVTFWGIDCILELSTNAHLYFLKHNFRTLCEIFELWVLHFPILIDPKLRKNKGPTIDGKHIYLQSLNYAGMATS